MWYFPELEYDLSDSFNKKEGRFIMDNKELEKLQRYIYKRPQNQSVQDVIAHIEMVNKKANLSQEEWNKLLIPACSGMIPEVFQWLLDNGAVITNNAIVLAEMIVSSQENRLKYLKKRMKLLDILFRHTEERYRSVVLGEALINACWFNNIYIIPFLIRKGADIHFLSSKGKTPYQCAGNYGERFGDYTLYNYLSAYIDTGKCEEVDKFYIGTDLMGNIVYQC